MSRLSQIVADIGILLSQRLDEADGRVPYVIAALDWDGDVIVRSNADPELLEELGEKLARSARNAKYQRR